MLDVGFEFRGKRYNEAEAGLRAFGTFMGAATQRMTPVLKKELQDFLETVAEAMNQRHSAPWPGGTGPKKLSVRSGDLMKSIRDSVTVTGATLSDVQGSIGSSLKYAKIQEFGGTVTPKKSKYLTIPLPAALDGRGLPLKPSARDWDNTFVIRSKAGNLLIVRRKGKDIEPLYVLKKSVRIPARLGLRDTLNRTVGYFQEKAINAMLNELRKGGA